MMIIIFNDYSNINVNYARPISNVTLRLSQS